MAQGRPIFARMNEQATNSQKGNYRLSAYTPIQIKEFHHLTREDALKAAKIAVKGKPGIYLGSIEEKDSIPGFNVYWNGKIIEKHLVKPAW